MTDDDHRRADLEAQIQAQIRHTREQIDAAADRVNRRAGRNLASAIGVGLGLGLAFLASLLWVKELFLVIVAVFVGFMLWELASALRFAGRTLPRMPLVVAGVSIAPATWLWGATGLWAATLAAIGAVVVWRMVESLVPGRVERGTTIRDSAAIAFCIAYTGFFGAVAALLTRHDGGQWWTLTFIALCVAADTGAWASGIMFGKTPMAPRISPKKTWEGFAGAVLLTLIVGVAMSVLLLQQPWWFGIVFAGAILVSSTLGDLSESLIKRDLGIKDISTWLPGHGGFLDRLDSILPSAPVAYALYAIAAS